MEQRLNPTEQAFYDLYTNRISQCPDDIVMQFIRMETEINPNWDDFPSEYYSHLKDTSIAFYAGIEYDSKNKVTDICITKTEMLKRIVDYEINWLLERDERQIKDHLNDILMNGLKGLKNLSNAELLSQCVDIGMFLMEE